jgi:methylmalonyl-CoA/ethylmalonyl-CoA epimerase
MKLGFFLEYLTVICSNIIVEIIKRINHKNRMKIDHICFAVKNLHDGISYWETVFGYKQMTEIVENSLQKVKVTFLCKEDSITIKLIEPVESNQALVNFVNRGGGFHHVCFKCSDIDEKMAELNKKGLLTLVPPQPGEAFNNNKIAFLLARYGLNIELIDTNEKAGML